MADTSRRALRLLSFLGARERWSLAEFATRLGVSERTVRRDIETLRQLDYPITTVHGPDGGYRLGAGHTLPPLLFDDDQALAVAVALQTAPNTCSASGTTPHGHWTPSRRSCRPARGRPLSPCA